MSKTELDHIDIVVTHKCNIKCDYCIDSFRNNSNKVISLGDVDKFLRGIREVTDEVLTVLLLGGEPTLLSSSQLKDITGIIHNYNFRSSISTNGRLYKKILKIEPYFDTIQVTVDDFKEINYFKSINHKVNIKLACDDKTYWNRFSDFEKCTKDFYRRSVAMYFNPVTFEELCTDKYIWDFLETLEWNRDGSYMYAFYNDIRFKKCIPYETNIIDEPKIPKLYPNGNYNNNWRNEDMVNYLNLKEYM